MIQTYRAIYENGVLRLLDAVNLVDGQEITISIDTHTLFQELMGDLPVQWPDRSTPRDEELEAQLAEAMREYSKGQPLSELIIEERGEI